MDAFSTRDKSLIAMSERAKIGDSLDLDEALRPTFPQDNRWDYLVSIPGSAKILALEPHSANDSEISVVIAKKRHAVTQLRTHLKPGHRVSEWLWVSHGRTSFSAMDRASKRLAQAGIRYVGKSLSSLT
jgi:hypothetical protein